MKPMSLRLLAAAALATAWLPSQSAVDVGVSVQIGQPGVHGRVDIGRFPPPQVIVVPPRAVVVRPEPVYPWVPPGHRKKWRKHCAAYGACATPVVFVRDEGYDDHVRPYAAGHGKGHGKGRDMGRDKGRDKHERSRGRDD